MQFKVGDKVLYRRLDKQGTIIEVVSESQYIIKVGYEFWSVPIKAILNWTPKKTRKYNKWIQEKASELKK